MCRCYGFIFTVPPLLRLLLTLPPLPLPLPPLLLLQPLTMGYLRLHPRLSCAVIVTAGTHRIPNARQSTASARTIIKRKRTPGDTRELCRCYAMLCRCPDSPSSLVSIALKTSIRLPRLCSSVLLACTPHPKNARACATRGDQQQRMRKGRENGRNTVTCMGAQRLRMCVCARVLARVRPSKLPASASS